MKPQEYIIVIGRQYGSGGRRLGRMLAEVLGIPYYDKELLREAADSMGFRSDLFEKVDERRSSKFLSMLGAACGASTYFTSGALHDGALYQMQSDVIRSLLTSGPCIIVGRTADYIGRDLPNLVSLFLYADKDVRIRRTMARRDAADEQQSAIWIDRQDSIRADYYNYYTGRKWGSADNYDLCINTSRLTPEQTCELVLQYLKHRAENAVSESKYGIFN